MIMLPVKSSNTKVFLLKADSHALTALYSKTVETDVNENGLLKISQMFPFR